MPPATEPRPGEFGNMRIMTAFPNVCSGKWVSHTATELCDGMARHVPVRIYVNALCEGYQSPLAFPSVPAWSNLLAFRIERLHPFMKKRLVKRYLRDLRPGDICWLWPGAVCQIAPAARAKGALVVTEAINCHTGTARRILLEEYQRCNLPPGPMPSLESVEVERQMYEVSDYVFAPSPRVAASMLENGVPQEKIIPTSYGWSPRRFNTHAAAERDSNELTALFVGTVCIRKGVHLLAAAWRDAHLAGRLLIAGAIEAPLDAASLQGPGINLLGHTNRVPTLMAGADIFAFPSLEEGGPMVTYEAAAMGLAILTTPMGAGAILRDGVDAIVLEPHDHAGWVKALQQLATDESLRRRLAAAAKARAADFTWDHVAERRLRILKSPSPNKAPHPRPV